MRPITRREVLAGAAGAACAGGGWQEAGSRPAREPEVRVLNPRGRVPVGLIIDDSTCLVNLAHFCIPQFAEVFPDRYRQPWKRLPREIPDSFVRKFGEWSAEHGVKGKFSLIPYPACVGWLDRDLPGWSRKELESSLELVRTLLAPNWDFHPEMVSHTWVIDIRTGRPYSERSERFMENWEWSVGRSDGELTDYVAFALQVLKNAGIHCEGVTTPGGFGNRSRPQLARAALEACRSVMGTEIPHYFRDLFTGAESVAPVVQLASGLDGSDPRCVVHTIGCTGDWFGGWDGLERGSADKMISPDLMSGRLPEVIGRGEPAILVCHWPGIYFNGEEVGFQILKEVVKRLNSRYDNLVWMKLSEIARYWAARELTRITRTSVGIDLHAPFACPAFTIEVTRRGGIVRKGGSDVGLLQVRSERELKSDTWMQRDGKIVVCLDLIRGENSLVF